MVVIQSINCSKRAWRYDGNFHEDVTNKVTSCLTPKSVLEHRSIVCLTLRAAPQQVGFDKWPNFGCLKA